MQQPPQGFGLPPPVGMPPMPPGQLPPGALPPGIPPMPPGQLPMQMAGAMAPPNSLLPPPGMGLPPGMPPMGMMGMMGPKISMTQKLDFPLEVQVHFKTKNIGHIKSKYKKKCRKLDNIFKYDQQFLKKADQKPVPEFKLGDTKKVRIRKAKKEKRELNKFINSERMKEWNPFEDEKHTTDPLKTLFVSNLNYDTSEKKIKREFEQFGDLKRVRIIKDREGKSRGYCFIEFEHKKDMVQAYKSSDYIKMDGRRLIVDFERGRTMLNFIPRKYGKGIGDTRRDKNVSRSRSRSRERRRRKKQEKKRKRSYSSSSSRSKTPEKPKKKRNPSKSQEKQEKQYEKKEKLENAERQDKKKEEKKQKRERKRSYSREDRPEKPERKSKRNKEDQQQPQSRQQEIPQPQPQQQQFQQQSHIDSMFPVAQGRQIDIPYSNNQPTHANNDEGEEGEIDQEYVEKQNGDKKKKRRKSKERGDKDRGDKQDRGDRGDRDRERERDRGDRERERDRGDRDRGDRDRSDRRDRDRDRDRKKKRYDY